MTSCFLCFNNHTIEVEMLSRSLLCLFFFSLSVFDSFFILFHSRSFSFYHLSTSHSLSFSFIISLSVFLSYDLSRPPVGLLTCCLLQVALSGWTAVGGIGPSSLSHRCSLHSVKKMLRSCSNSLCRVLSCSVPFRSVVLCRVVLCVLCVLCRQTTQTAPCQPLAPNTHAHKTVPHPALQQSLDGLPSEDIPLTPSQGDPVLDSASPGRCDCIRLFRLLQP